MIADLNFLHFLYFKNDNKCCSDDIDWVLILQSAQTGVVKSNLNPVWNEELMLSVPQDFGALKLVRLSIYQYFIFRMISVL